MFLLHCRNCPLEELDRNHLGHVDAYAINAFSGPEEQDIPHLDPGGRNRIKLLLSATLIEDTVVQFDRFVPIVLARMTCEAVVAGYFRRKLFVALQVFVHREALSREVVKVIERRESPFGMIILAQVFYALGFADALILTRYMVWYKINQYAQTGFVSAFNKRLEFLHSFALVLRQIRVHVVIIGDGIGGTGFAFGDRRVVILRCRMADDAGVPNMRSTQVYNRLERTLVDIRKSSTAVLFFASVIRTCLVVVRKITREELIDNSFAH